MGLEAALASQRAELNLIAGCDMPDIQLPDLTRLLNVAEESKALCVMARDARVTQAPALRGLSK